MSSMNPIPEQVLREQQEYYRQRAAEYDEWWRRLGRYDRGAEENAVWFGEQDEVRAAFVAAGWSGHALELAGGTGIWTSWLAARGIRVSVLDGAPEMIALNRQQLADAGLAELVDYQQIDLFDWQPQRAFDGLFVGYFLSHVPAELLDPLLAKIAASIRPGGWLGIIDGRRDERSSSPDQTPPPEGTDVMTRRLNDGRTYQIVKRYDTPTGLQARLAVAGIDADVRTTGVHFLYATGRKR